MFRSRAQAIRSQASKPTVNSCESTGLSRPTKCTCQTIEIHMSENQLGRKREKAAGGLTRIVGHALDPQRPSYSCLSSSRVTFYELQQRPTTRRRFGLSGARDFACADSSDAVSARLITSCRFLVGRYWFNHS